jgi:GntR family transcriptional regulator of arabinose operon
MVIPPASTGHLKQPKYQRLKTQLAEQLAAGVFPPGAALPKERELAASLGVALGTVRQALQELEAEGRIRRVRGHGTFATMAPPRPAATQVSLFSLVLPQVRDGLYPSLIHGFERATNETSFQISVHNSGNELSRQEVILRQVVESGAAGVALVPTTFPTTPPEQLQSLVTHGTPLVFCHRAVEGVAAPLVSWSGEAVGRLTAQALLDQGHRSIATVVAFRDPKTSEVIGGIQAVLREAGLPPLAHRVRYHGERLPGVQARGAIREVLVELLDAPERPTAIHCLNLPDAEQVYLLAGELGFPVPDKLSLIYFGDSRRAGGLAERLTCVAVEAEAIGLAAGRLLGEMATGALPKNGERRIDVPVMLLPGETVVRCST